MTQTVLVLGATGSTGRRVTRQLRERGFTARAAARHGEVIFDAEDIAAVAVESLVGDGHAGQTYEVTGPEALTFADAVAKISEATGRTIRYKGEPDDYRAIQRAAGVPSDQTEAEIAAFAVQIETGEAGPTDTVERITGRPPKPFTQYAAAAAADGAWRD